MRSFYVFWFGAGIILFFMLWFAVVNRSRNLTAKIDELQRSNNEIKAILYDKEHPPEEKTEETLPTEAEIKAKTK
jgi:hypothetical protein